MRSITYNIEHREWIEDFVRVVNFPWRQHNRKISSALILSVFRPRLNFFLWKIIPRFNYWRECVQTLEEILITTLKEALSTLSRFSKSLRDILVSMWCHENLSRMWLIWNFHHFIKFKYIYEKKDYRRCPLLQQLKGGSSSRSWELKKKEENWIKNDISSFSTRLDLD